MEYYRYIGQHADYLRGGRPIGMGDIVSNVETDDPLIERGLLLKIESSRQTERRTTK